MDFSYGSVVPARLAGGLRAAAARRLLGDSTLFARWDEVERAWEIVEGLIEALGRDAAGPFPNYAAGTWGPRRPRTLMAREGREWRRL